MMLDFLRSKCIDFNLVVCGISFRKGVLRQWWSRFSGDIAAIYMPRTLYGREKRAQQEHREIWGTTLQAGKGSSGKMERGKSSFSYMMSQKTSTPEIWMEWLWCRQEGSIFLHWLVSCVSLEQYPGKWQWRWKQQNTLIRLPSFRKTPRRQGQRVRTENLGLHCSLVMQH